MRAVTLQYAPLGVRMQSFVSTKQARTASIDMPLRKSSTPSSRSRVVAEAAKDPKEALTKVVSGAMAVSIALLPVVVPSSYAALDTQTKEKGVSAKIEGSDITSENQKSVLEKLEKKILPEAKQLLGKVGKDNGSNYPASVAKELETVQQEVEGLIRQANEGGDMSNVKSSASGIEQQINALKAIVGFD